MNYFVTFFLLLAAVCVSSAPLDTPFNGFNVKQCVYGTADFNIILKDVGVVGGLDLPNPGFGLGAPVFASDPENQRFLFLNQQSAQYTLANGTYTLALDTTTFQMKCYYDASYTFAHEVSEHTTLIDIGKLNLLDRYYGLAKDVGSCETQTAFLIHTGPTGVIRQLSFSQGYPTPVNDPSPVLAVTGILTYDQNCPTTQSHFATIFQLPSICFEPALPSWCATFRFE
jgi:hypothetical protein